jgi:hypothetical protein
MNAGGIARQENGTEVAGDGAGGVRGLEEGPTWSTGGQSALSPPRPPVAVPPVGEPPSNPPAPPALAEA